MDPNANYAKETDTRGKYLAEFMKDAKRKGY